MYCQNRMVFILAVMLVSCTVFANDTQNGMTLGELEVGPAVAGEEALYFGFYSKYSVPLTRSLIYPYAGLGLTGYFDFIGPEPQANLEDHVDMRVIPAAHLGLNLAIYRFDIRIEVPVGKSIAHTRGTLVNKRLGIKESYSTTEVFWHYGTAMSLRYRFDHQNGISLYGFYPLVEDVAHSSPTIGIGWTRLFTSK